MKSKTKLFIIFFIVFFSLFLSRIESHAPEIKHVAFVFLTIFFLIGYRIIYNLDFYHVKNKHYKNYIGKRMITLFLYFAIFYSVSMFFYLIDYCLLFEYIDSIIFNYFSVSVHSSIIYYLFTLSVSAYIVFQSFFQIDFNISVLNRICTELSAEIEQNENK